MIKKPPQILFLIPMLCFILFLMVLYTIENVDLDFSKILEVRKPVYAENADSDTIHYFPLIFVIERLPDIELTEAWTSDSEGQLQDTFYLGDTIRYIASGENHLDEAASVDLSWGQEGPCGSTEIYSDTLILPAGTWENAHDEFTPDCAGDYEGRVKIDHVGYTSTLTTTFQVHLPSQVITNTQHAFDRCWLPTVDQMQTWWDESPYSVWNIYLGGIHYFCPSGDLTPAWVQAVAQQGWKFILTWVGPQAPCSQFIHKFSGDPGPDENYLEAYSDGITEAAAALAAAESIGISGEKIIYYDLEFYPGSDTECNQAVNIFLDGWTTWLQLQGDKSGVYASPCNSNMEDWVNVTPPPDDIWIAHWISDGFDPTATVWDVACGLPNSYWADHQRIRQYAGENTENWGGVALTIDSNVLDGEVTAITGTIPTATPLLGTQKTKYTDFSSFQIQDVDLISSQDGWVLQGNRLLITADGGETWHVITPDLDDAVIQDIKFINPALGWVAALRVNSNLSQKFEIYQTMNGGVTWVSHPFPVSMAEVSRVHLEFIDEQTGWAILRIKTGSSFSLGRLFATLDGGITWEERNTPMGEPVVFVDVNNGWMVGGPAGNQIYQTPDGGHTWYPQKLPNLPDGHAYIGQPVFGTPKNGVLPVTLFSLPRSSLLLYTTEDGGKLWRLSRNIELSPDFEAGAAIPFNLNSGRWWAATPDSNNLLTSTSLAYEPERASTTGLPPGVVKLDYVTSEVGWALIQDNQCYGDKIPEKAWEPNAFYCRSDTRLYQTNDGGTQWDEIQP